MPKASSRIHPELRKMVQLLPPFSVSQRTLWIPRTLINLARAGRPPKDIAFKTTVIAGSTPGQSVRLRVYAPTARTAPTPALLWMHGGGYIMGNAQQDDGACIEYVRSLGIVVVSVDYRLAPEYPFPAGLEDCYSALRWVCSQSDIDATRVAIGGASAGAGLAAALAQLAHDRGELRPVLQLLRYPMLDDRTARAASAPDDEYPLWTWRSNVFGWRAYLGAAWAAAELPACAVPARRADLTRLPPAWIGVGTADLFHDENVAYAARLREAGVPCELQVVPGGCHAFDMLVRNASISRAFYDGQLVALRKYLRLA
jgi:acetyl esterase/lipase